MFWWFFVFSLYALTIEDRMIEATSILTHAIVSVWYLSPPCAKTYKFILLFLTLVVSCCTEKTLASYNASPSFISIEPCLFIPRILSSCSSGIFLSRLDTLNISSLSSLHFNFFINYFTAVSLLSVVSGTSR